jgi:hypothetical protein
MKKIIIGLLLVLILLSGMFGGCSVSNIAGSGGEVEILDAYCTYGTTSSFDFSFSIKNTGNEDMDVDYTWSLNDPSADEPVYKGNGNITIRASDTEDIVVTIDKICEYDARFYVMYVAAYNNDEQIGSYRKQKSTYDWDYSVIPPVERSNKPDYTHLWVDTLITEDPSGYKITVNDIIFLPTNRTCILQLNDIGITLKAARSDEGPAILLSDIMYVNSKAPHNVKFYDANNDGMLSAGDYFTMDEEAEGMLIEFSSINEPSIHFYDIRRVETIEKESPNAIRVIDAGYEIDKDYLDFYIEVDAHDIQNLIDNNSIRVIHPGTGGSSFYGIGEEWAALTTQGGILEGRIDLSRFEEEYDSLFLIIYLSDSINEVLSVICEIP